MPLACFLVIGTPRSGTSCVAGVLHHLGVRMALGAMPPARPINPLGFFEDVEMTALLMHFARPDDPKRHRWEARDQKRREQVPAAIRARCAAGVSWGIKTFTLAYCLPLVESSCPIPMRIVRVIRSLEKSRESARKAFGTDGRVDEIHAQILAALRGSQSPVLEVAYDALLAAPREQVARIADYASISVTEAAVSFVDASLRTIP